MKLEAGGYTFIHEQCGPVMHNLYPPNPISEALRLLRDDGVMVMATFWCGSKNANEDRWAKNILNTIAKECDDKDILFADPLLTNSALVIARERSRLKECFQPTLGGLQRLDKLVWVPDLEKRMQCL